MYWNRSLERSDLENGRTFAHGTTRLNLGEADLAAFVDPPDAALMFGFRGLEPGATFEKSFAVWMATMRRRAGSDAILGSLQRIFPALVDDKSLENLLQGVVETARQMGYERVWLEPSLLKEPLFAPAVKVVVDALGQPLVVVPSSGMSAFQLGPPPGANPEEARKRALQRLGMEHAKADALKNDRYWNHGRGNAQAWVATGYDVAMQWVRAVAPLPGEPAQAYLDRVAAHVRQARGRGPDEDDESWFDGAIDEAARIISGAAS